MKNFKVVAAAMFLLAVTGCATFDRYAVADTSTMDRTSAPYRSGASAADATPGAGAPGGAGAGAAVR